MEGKVTDYGDVVKVVRYLVKGRRLTWSWHISVPSKSTRQTRDGSVSQLEFMPSPEGVVSHMDLKADQQVTISGEWTDEMGNPVGAPSDATYAFSVSDALVLTVTDNGDGTATAVAVGTLGVANVHAEVSVPGRSVTTGDLQVVVVAGDAERFAPRVRPRRTCDSPAQQTDALELGSSRASVCWQCHTT
jgi:hypothetical protein